MRNPIFGRPRTANGRPRGSLRNNLDILPCHFVYYLLVTVTLSVADFPSTLTVIVAEPALLAVTIPSDDTEATDDELDVNLGVPSVAFGGSITGVT